MNRSHIRLSTLLAIYALLAGLSHADGLFGIFRRSSDITLADGGEALAVIVVPQSTMAWEGDSRRLLSPRHSGYKHDEVIPETMRRTLRDSVIDLAHYLGKMSGTEFEIVEALPPDDRRTPIYIGALAEDLFGPVGITMADRYGFRVVADPSRGVGLYGESEYGTSYAIYELLHRLGCRWYMPSEMGECIPEIPTLNIAAMNESLAPATETRHFWSRTYDADFARRNRHTPRIEQVDGQHALENYITREQLEENPEWALHYADGGISSYLFRWTRRDVADAVADRIIERLNEGYRQSVSLSPGDYVRYSEDPEELKHDPEPRVWESAAGRWSVTDRLYMLANRVAERVGEKYPDVLFGLYAYVNYNLPPAREPVHPNVIPMLAPIDFNRHHPMTWENHPNGFWLRDLVEGWGNVAERVAFRGFAFNLAELSAPCPFITKWGTDIPILMENNMTYFQPETMSGWDSMMPGYYLSIRMTFDPHEKPEAILEELWERFYGAAAEPMGQYWHHIDRAWIEAEEYSGNCYGYLRIFTPEVMETARALIDEALSQCETAIEYRRVRFIDDTFSLFELFMKMREDYANARLRDLASDLDVWFVRLRYLQDRYRPQYPLGALSERYARRFFDAIYGGASEMEREYARHGRPMLEWKWKHNPGAESDSLTWTAPDYDDGEWPTKHVVRDTWSTISHHNTLTDEASGQSGRMVYRAAQRLDALPEGKRATLWIGSTDGSAKLFVNGTHVPYVVPEDTRRHEAGDTIDRFSGYCNPAKFDVTDAMLSGDNQFTILCERTNLNELGTGGLMGPVVVFRER